MFAFMWIAAGFNLFGFLIHLFLTCCCASKRDVRTGRRRGNKAAYGDAVGDEKKPAIGRKFASMPKFGQKKTTGEVV
jgi:hypothetical protein